ncbi:MAG: hypothetical protein N2Z65_00100 [Clostridiales bacterium]|nr:hypothetical protein [Clostridiales bacterium]
MEQNVLTNIPLKITEADLLKKMHLDKSCDQRNLILRILSEALIIAAPKAMFRLAVVKQLKSDTVSIDGELIQSPYVLKILAEQEMVYPFVATCGKELDHWSKSKTDVFESYVCECIKDLVLGQCIKYVRIRLFAILQKGTLLSSISPGSHPLWPLEEGQELLFRLLTDVTEKTGVHLTERYLMSPVKSLSGIFFTTNKQYQSCAFCKKENCNERKEPFSIQI